MSFEIKGQLVKKFDIESKTASFQTREFVILIPRFRNPKRSPGHKLCHASIGPPYMPLAKAGCKARQLP